MQHVPWQPEGPVYWTFVAKPDFGAATGRLTISGAYDLGVIVKGRQLVLEGEVMHIVQRPDGMAMSQDTTLRLFIDADEFLQIAEAAQAFVSPMLAEEQQREDGDLP